MRCTELQEKLAAAFTKNGILRGLAIAFIRKQKSWKIKEEMDGPGLGAGIDQ
jgi:hypothetical protein